MEKVVVYRSQGEANFDEFWFNMAPTWLYEHWFGVTIFILIVMVLIFIVPMTRKNRY